MLEKGLAAKTELKNVQRNEGNESRQEANERISIREKAWWEKGKKCLAADIDKKHSSNPNEARP